MRAPSGFTLYHESCLACQHFISVWLGKLKPNKLSTGCQNQLKEMAAERPRIRAGCFYFSCACTRFSSFAAQSCSQQNRAPDKTAMLRMLPCFRIQPCYVSGNVGGNPAETCYRFGSKQPFIGSSRKSRKNKGGLEKRVIQNNTYSGELTLVLACCSVLITIVPIMYYYQHQ